MASWAPLFFGGEVPQYVVSARVRCLTICVEASGWRLSAVGVSAVDG